MTKRDKLFAAIHKLALHRADKAFAEAQPTPMVVAQHANPLDDGSPVVQSWDVPDGPCGFAWVSVHPGGSAFARWLKREGIGRTDSYAGGVTVWAPGGDRGSQSMTRKEAAAHDYAKTLTEELRDHKLTIYAHSRLD